MLRLIEESVSQCTQCKKPPRYKVVQLDTEHQSWPNIHFSNWPKSKITVALQPITSSHPNRKSNIQCSEICLFYFKAPSRNARIFSLCGWVKQCPMAVSVSWIRLRKRSRSRAISSQCPLRDACRANGQVCMT